LSWRHRGGVEVYVYSLFNFGATWGWVVNTTSHPLYPQKWPSTNCIGGWVGSKAGPDGCGKSHPHWYFIPGLTSL
jgi:hypothetical protein